MSPPAQQGPPTWISTAGGHRIEYRLQTPPGAALDPGRLVLVLHGGHMSASCRFGEDTFLDAGWSVLVVSRPGYGRTSAAAGPSHPEFAIRLAALCRHLQLQPRVVVGVSLGARTALTLAAFRPSRIDRVVLVSPVSFAPWPVHRSRAVARIAFNPVSQAGLWPVLHRRLTTDPEFLARAIGSLTTLEPGEAIRRLGADRTAMVEFLLACRSGRGFSIDLRPPADVTSEVVTPSLIIATRHDGAVGFDHPERLAASLHRTELVEVDAPTHLPWLGDAAAVTRDTIRSFLA